jgi:hypothetical protein
LRRAGVEPDQRVAEAIDLVEGKPDSDGRWPLENPHAGANPRAGEVHFDRSSRHGMTGIGPGGRVIGIKRAVYHPATLTVTLHPKERINVHYTYTLIVDGTAPGGLSNTQDSCSTARMTAGPTVTTVRH